MIEYTMMFSTKVLLIAFVITVSVLIISTDVSICITTATYGMMFDGTVEFTRRSIIMEESFIHIPTKQ